MPGAEGAAPSPEPVTTTEYLRKLQDQIDQLERQRANHEKWFQDSAWRIDVLEGQARARTRELDGKIAQLQASDQELLSQSGNQRLAEAHLRNEHEKKLLGFETKMTSSLAGAMAAFKGEPIGAISEKFAGNNFKEHIEAIDHTVRQDQAYLQAQFEAKPGQEHTLFLHFK